MRWGVEGERADCGREGEEACRDGGGGGVGSLAGTGLVPVEDWGTR